MTDINPAITTQDGIVELTEAQLEWYRTRKADYESTKDDRQAASIREQRNRRLAACDWTQVLDAPVDATAWAAYRAQLRDVPSQEGFPWEVEWPEPPAN